MSEPLRGISSMATRQLLADLCAAWSGQGREAVRFESVGGVDALRRVQSGESFDLVVLASDATAKLIASGSVLPDSRVDLVHSGVACCVRAGTAQPTIDTEAALREAVMGAPTIGYSTGPSGVALMRLFQQWGIAEAIAPRTVQAPPGVPVGTLVARGEVALGFQQLSELMNLEGIDLVGPLPQPVQITTTFSGAVCVGSPRAEAARRVLAFMASPDTADLKQRNGMSPP